MRACACALLRSLWLLVESVVRCYPLVLVGTPNPSQPWFWTCCGVTASALPPLRGLLYNIGVPRSPTRGRGRARAEAGLVRMIRAASTDSGVGVLSVCHVRVSGVCLLYVVRPSRTE